MDKKIKSKTSKPKTSKKSKTSKKPKSSKQKGGSDNIANTTEGLFKSFFNFGKTLFTEIDSLTKLPGELKAVPNTKA